MTSHRLARPGSLTVTGGTVVTPAGALSADVVIEDGRIAALARPGPAPAAPDRLDATGLPRAAGRRGPALPHHGGRGRGDQGRRARRHHHAVLSFTNPGPGEGTAGVSCAAATNSPAAQPAVDVGLHAMLYQPDEVAGLRGAPGRRGVRDQGLPRLLRTGDHVVRPRAVRADGRRGPAWPGGPGPLRRGRADRRPGRRGGGGRPHRGDGSSRRPARRGPRRRRWPGCWRRRTITGATCYLVHLSCAEALDQVRLARRRGGPALHAEVCLHHLLLDDRCYLRDDAERYLVCPPLRPPGHQEALWRALADGTLDTVGSDHCQERSRTIGEFAPDGRVILRDRRRRGAAAAAAVARAGAGPADRAAGRGRLREPGAGLRPLPAQGSDRPGVRRRPADLGSRARNDHHGGHVRRPARATASTPASGSPARCGTSCSVAGCWSGGPFRRHGRSAGPTWPGPADRAGPG